MSVACWYVAAGTFVFGVFLFAGFVSLMLSAKNAKD